MSTSDYTPKAKAKGKAYWHWNTTKTKLDFPAVIVFCCFFFVFGFLCSSLRSQVSGVRQRGRQLLNSVEYELMGYGKTGDDSISVIPFQIISWRPRSFYFPKFATPEQCQHIINLAKPYLAPSKLALRKGESEGPQDVRTRHSMGTFLSVSDDPTGVLDAIEEKIAKATKIPRTHYEHFNVLRYELGQKYDSHLDAFPVEQYGPQKSQRVATFLVYLSEVGGGETAFPFENGLNMDGSYDFKKCIGLKVKPRIGDGLLFYSLFPNNTIDTASLHTSCPVIKGEKWVVTKWIRDQKDFF